LVADVCSKQPPGSRIMPAMPSVSAATGDAYMVTLASIEPGSAPASVSV
jgi:hypothetical protein